VIANNQQIIQLHGGIKLLLNVMQFFPLHPELQGNAAAALANLSLNGMLLVHLFWFTNLV
jgi:hypothetical protein